MYILYKTQILNLKLIALRVDGVILHSSQCGLVGQCVCRVVPDWIVLEVPAITEKTTFFTWNHQASAYKWTVIGAFNQYLHVCLTSYEEGRKVEYKPL